MADHLEDGVEPQDDAYDAFNEITGSQDPDTDDIEASDHADDLDDERDDDLPEGDDEDEDDQAQDDPDTTDEDDDPLAGLDERRRQYFAQLQQENSKLHNDVRANAGRVSALTKKLNELTETQRKQQGDALGELPKLAGKNFEEVERDWPEVAEYVRTMVGEAVKHTRQSIQHDLQPLQQGYESIQQSQHQAQVDYERQRLTEAHGDWHEVVQSLGFNRWLNQQPQGIAQLMSSMSADDNIALLNLYKSSKAQPATPAKSRKANLAQHAELPRKGAGQPQSLPDDPAEYFDLITRPKRR